jgi:uncharacterized protein (UPF0262 family)
MAPRPGKTGRLVAVDLDEDSLARPHPFIEAERAVAIDDLLAENSFQPAGRPAGAFRLKLSVRDNRLVLTVTDRDGAPVVTHILSLTPFARVMKDYFLVVGSHQNAMRTAGAPRIEAIDMGRRGIHNEGAETLRERLAGKIEMDRETARRLFTLLCALRWKG